MKQKLLSLLIITTLLVTVFTVAVGAAPMKQSLIVSKTKKLVTKKPSVVKINKSVKVGKKIKLKSTLKLNNTSLYTYKSTKKKVAKVSKKGVVTGKKVGTATIKVRQKATGFLLYKVKVKVKAKLTAEAANLRLMTCIINSEAGGQCYAGKKAVGIVIMNRVESKSFPNSVKGVVYQSCQFGPVTDGSLERSYKMYDNGQLNNDCKKAAQEALDGEKNVNYKGKNINMKGFCFFNGYVAGSRLKIDGHQFK